MKMSHFQFPNKTYKVGKHSRGGGALAHTHTELSTYSTNVTYITVRLGVLGESAGPPPHSPPLGLAPLGLQAEVPQGESVEGLW